LNFKTGECKISQAACNGATAETKAKSKQTSMGNWKKHNKTPSTEKKCRKTPTKTDQNQKPGPQKRFQAKTTVTAPVLHSILWDGKLIKGFLEARRIKRYNGKILVKVRGF